MLPRWLSNQEILEFENSLLPGSFLIKFSFLFSNKERRTDGWITRKKKKTQHSPTGDLTRVFRLPVRSSASCAVFFHLIQLSSIFLGEKGREFDQGILDFVMKQNKSKLKTRTRTRTTTITLEMRICQTCKLAKVNKNHQRVKLASVTPNTKQE